MLILMIVTIVECFWETHLLTSHFHSLIVFIIALLQTILTQTFRERV